MRPNAPQRIVIDLCRGDGPIAGRFREDDEGEATAFSSWMELVTLLEGVRGAATADDVEEEKE